MFAFALLLHDPAHGYRFFFSPESESRIPLAEDAMRWDTDVWPPGSVLRFFLAEDPGWTSAWKDEWYPRFGNGVPFESVDEAVPYFVEALTFWSEIESADVRWEVAGVVDRAAVGQDGMNLITVNPDSDVRISFARTWWRRDADTGEWPLVECDIVMSRVSIAILRFDRMQDRNLVSPIHELGHCLGLTHSAMGTQWQYAEFVREKDPRDAFGGSPVMSYGAWDTNGISPDDIVGASLLRPAEGWLRRRGTISGRVTVVGQPARYAQVWAAPVSGSVAGEAVNSFTDEGGDFAVEGLSPGDYLIWAGPINSGCGGHLALWGTALFDAREGIALELVTVGAGGERGGVALDLQPGRKGTTWRVFE